MTLLSALRDGAHRMRARWLEFLVMPAVLATLFELPGWPVAYANATNLGRFLSPVSPILVMLGSFAASAVSVWGLVLLAFAVTRSVTTTSGTATPAIVRALRDSARSDRDSIAGVVWAILGISVATVTCLAAASAVVVFSSETASEWLAQPGALQRFTPARAFGLFLVRVALAPVMAAPVMALSGVAREGSLRAATLACFRIHRRALLGLAACAGVPAAGAMLFGLSPAIAALQRLAFEGHPEGVARTLAFATYEELFRLPVVYVDAWLVVLVSLTVHSLVTTSRTHAEDSLVTTFE